MLTELQTHWKQCDIWERLDAVKEIFAEVQHLPSEDFGALLASYR